MRSLVLVSVLAMATVVTISTSRSLAQDTPPTQVHIAALLVKAQAGDAKAQAELGRAYESGIVAPQDYGQAALWFAKAAEQGDSFAQDHLCFLYSQGEGVPQDDVQSASWCRKAAEQGDAWAEWSLGILYEEGIGLPQDYSQAASWYRKAANRGTVGAQARLGSLYFIGEGVPKADSLAAFWLRKAAEKDDAKSQWNLGYLYEHGRGVKQDYLLAARWYRKAAEQGNVAGQICLGFLYSNGRGARLDYAQAAVWFRKAAEQGDADAQFNLAGLYDKGKGVPQDHVEETMWLRKAAEQGNVDAQFVLGSLYEDGLGVSQDYAQAVSWYRKAADRGSVDAQKVLAKLQGTADIQVPSQEQQDRTLIMSSRDIAQRARKSVVLLEMNDANSQPLCYGSGFFVSDGIVATNAHVIEGAFGGTAKLIGETDKLQILGVVAINWKNDLALLKMSSSAPRLPIESSNTKLEVGDKVYVYGNPKGLEGTFSEGIVSGLRGADTGSIIQMTAPISPGSSGGPVMDVSGAVIGLAEAIVTGGQNLNLAVPASYLSQLLASVNSQTSTIPLGNMKEESQTDKSILDGLGMRAESGVVVSEFKFVEAENGYGRDRIGYALRITNKLPVDVSYVSLRIIYYDGTGSVMDFEEFFYLGTIPAGLTKTVTKDRSSEATNASDYYERRSLDGGPLPKPTTADPYNYYVARMKPKVEIRVIGFRTEKPE